MGAITFIDALVEEYQYNSQLLITCSRTPLEERVGQVVVNTGALLASIPRSQQTRIRNSRAPVQVALFDRTLYSWLHEKMESALCGFDRRLDLSVRSHSKFEREFFLRELYLQALVNSDEGIHLVLAGSQKAQIHLITCLQQALGQGFYTYWQLAIRDPNNQKQQKDLFLNYLQNLVKAFSYRTSDGKADHLWCAAALRPFALFGKEVVAANFAAVKKLFTQDLMNKIKAAVSHYLKASSWKIASSFSAKGMAIVDEVVPLLGTNNPALYMKQNLDALRSCLKALGKLGNSQEPYAFCKTHIDLCLQTQPQKKEEDPSSLQNFVAFYTFASRLAAVCDEVLPLGDLSVYPNADKRICLLSPAAGQINSDTGHTIVLASDHYESLTQEQQKALFSRKVRSFFVYDAPNYQELMPKLANSIRKHFPNEPLGYHAIIGENIKAIEL